MSLSSTIIFDSQKVLEILGKGLPSPALVPEILKLEGPVSLN